LHLRAIRKSIFWRSRQRQAYHIVCFGARDSGKLITSFDFGARDSSKLIKSYDYGAAHVSAKINFIFYSDISE
jgi:hypothetical protein